MKFLSSGGFRIQSVVSSSEVQFLSGSFGFVRGWTDPVWSLRLAAVTRGFRGKKACCHDGENNQPGHSRTRSPLIAVRHTLLSSADRALTWLWGRAYNHPRYRASSLMFMWHLNTKKGYSTVKLYLSADERLYVWALTFKDKENRFVVRAFSHLNPLYS